MKLFRIIRLSVLFAACMAYTVLSPLAHAQSASPSPSPSASASPNPNAISPEEAYRTYRETNYVLYYDHSCGGSSSSSSGPGGNAGGCGNPTNGDAANEKQIYDYFVAQFQSKGYSQDEAQKAASGILGNWLQESAFNPARKDGMGCGSSAAYGVAQWCGGRIDKVKQYMKDHGLPEDCLGGELEYAWSEMEQMGLPDKMKGLSPADAANMYDRIFESSNGTGERAAKAEAEYAKMTGQGSSTANSAPGSGTPAAGSTSSSSSSSGSNSASCSAKDDGTCKDPFRDLKNSEPMRWDGGEDYGGSGGSGPIYAVCPSTIEEVTTGSGWPGSPGSYIRYKVTSGKAKDLHVYIAEDCTPKVKTGDQVDTNTNICDYKDEGTHLEIGWAKEDCYCGANSSYVSWSDYPGKPNSWASNSGQDFGKFLQSIGGKNGHPDSGAGVSNVPPPPNWPKWDGSSPSNL